MHDACPRVLHGARLQSLCRAGSLTPPYISSLAQKPIAGHGAIFLLMNGYGSSEEHRPVTYLNGYPLYAAHFVVAVLVASMFVTALLMTASVSFFWNWLPFDSARVLKGEAWRLFTYGLVNPPSVMFVVDMAMIVWFGREVEKIVGRRRFLGFYGILYVLTPLVLTVIGIWLPKTMVGQTGAFAIFIAFATFYPGAMLMFNILAKWMALILVGIFTLIALANHDWVSLFSLWATSGFAYGFVRYEQGHISFPKIRWPRRGPKLRVLPDLKPEPARSRRDDNVAEVDALLDKIAKSGLASLTAKERAKLEQRRKDLKGK